MPFFAHGLHKNRWPATVLPIPVLDHCYLLSHGQKVKVLLTFYAGTKPAAISSTQCSVTQNHQDLKSCLLKIVLWSLMIICIRGRKMKGMDYFRERKIYPKRGSQHGIFGWKTLLLPQRPLQK